MFNEITLNENGKTQNYVKHFPVFLHGLHYSFQKALDDCTIGINSMPLTCTHKNG